MNTLDFIKSDDAHVKSIAKEFVANGITIGGTLKQYAKEPSLSATVACLKKATEEELIQICTDFNWVVSDEEVATASTGVLISLDGEITNTIKTAEGEDVQVLMLKFIGHSKESLKFEMSNGNIVLHSGDKLRQLEALGGLSKGDMLGFKPESITPTKTPGYYLGVPNFASSKNLLALLESNAENKRLIKAQIAQIRALGLPKSIVDRRIDEMADKAIDPIKLTKPKFV